MCRRRAGGWRTVATPWPFLLAVGTVASTHPAAARSVPADCGAARVTPSRGSSVDSLQLSLSVPDSIGPRDAASIITTVHNLTNRVLTLYLQGRTPTTDLVISDTTGRVLWRKLEGHALPAILRADQLAPGARLTITDRWSAAEGPQRTLPPGAYLLHAELLTERGRLSSDPVSIRVTPA